MVNLPLVFKCFFSVTLFNGLAWGRVALSELISLALLCGIYKSLSQSIVFRYYPRAIYDTKSR